MKLKNLTESSMDLRKLNKFLLSLLNIDSLRPRSSTSLEILTRLSNSLMKD